MLSLQFFGAVSVHQNRHHLALRCIGVIAQKLGLAGHIQTLTVVHLKARVILRALTLGGHSRLVAIQIQIQSTLTRNVVGQINRKSVGIVELKNDITRDGFILDRLQRLLKNRHAVIERARKLLLFCLQGGSYRSLLFDQLWIGLAHLGDQLRHQRGKKGLPGTQLVAMTDRTTNDAPQHIAPALVARQHAVGNEECRRA